MQSALIGQLTQSIVIGRTPQARMWNVMPITINARFSFQVSFINSSPKGELSCVTDTVMMLICICSTQAAIKTISDGLYTPLWCDPVPLTHTHTHTHTARYAQNSTFEQSIANTWTNNKTNLQSLIRKCQIVIAKSKLPRFFTNSLRAQQALYSPWFTKLSSIKCVSQIRTFGLCCCVVNKS